jgi:hypothetical protein
LKASRIAVANTRNKPRIKVYSAIVSKTTPCSLVLLMERKEKIQLIIKARKENIVILSISVFSLRFRILIEVRTTKQNPTRLEDAARICGDFLYSCM